MTTIYYQLSNIICSPHRLILIPTGNCESVTRLFQEYNTKTGITVYWWTRRKGLQTLEAEPVTVPETKSLLALHDFMQNSVHFAVYLLENYPYKPGTKVAAQFNRFIVDNPKFRGKTVLVGARYNLDSVLQNHTLIVDCGNLEIHAHHCHRTILNLADFSPHRLQKLV